jgi:hypothetical protein
MTNQLAEISKEKATQRTSNPVRLRVVPVKEEFIGQRLLPIRDAARYLGRGEDSLREMIYTGVFPVIQLGNRSKIWLDVEDLNSWIESKKHYMSDERS